MVEFAMRDRRPEEENFSSNGTAKYTEPGIIPTNLYPSRYRTEAGLLHAFRGRDSWVARLSSFRVNSALRGKCLAACAGAAFPKPAPAAGKKAKIKTCFCRIYAHEVAFFYETRNAWIWFWLMKRLGA
jgi:hypothetical protein